MFRKQEEELVRLRFLLRDSKKSVGGVESTKVAVESLEIHDVEMGFKACETKSKMKIFKDSRGLLVLESLPENDNKEQIFGERDSNLGLLEVRKREAQVGNEDCFENEVGEIRSTHETEAKTKKGEDLKSISTGSWKYKGSRINVANFAIETTLTEKMMKRCENSHGSNSEILDEQMVLEFKIPVREREELIENQIISYQYTTTKKSELKSHKTDIENCYQRFSMCQTEDRRISENNNEEELMIDDLIVEENINFLKKRDTILAKRMEFEIADQKDFKIAKSLKRVKMEEKSDEIQIVQEDLNISSKVIEPEREQALESAQDRNEFGQGVEDESKEDVNMALLEVGNIDILKEETETQLEPIESKIEIEDLEREIEEVQEKFRKSESLEDLNDEEDVVDFPIENFESLCGQIVSLFEVNCRETFKSKFNEIFNQTISLLEQLKEANKECQKTGQNQNERPIFPKHKDSKFQHSNITSYKNCEPKSENICSAMLQNNLLFRKAKLPTRNFKILKGQSKINSLLKSRGIEVKDQAISTFTLTSILMILCLNFRSVLPDAMDRLWRLIISVRPLKSMISSRIICRVLNVLFRKRVENIEKDDLLRAIARTDNAFGYLNFLFKELFYLGEFELSPSKRPIDVSKMQEIFRIKKNSNFKAACKFFIMNHPFHFEEVSLSFCPEDWLRAIGMVTGFDFMRKSNHGLVNLLRKSLSNPKFRGTHFEVLLVSAVDRISILNN